MCEGLDTFQNLIDLIGECPPKLEIDRIENEGSYTCGKCPECLKNGWPMNVRWATKKQQQRNKRSNRIITVRGFTGCVAEVCEHFGVSHNRTRLRLHYGWPEDLAIFAPQFFRPSRDSLARGADTAVD